MLFEALGDMIPIAVPKLLFYEGPAKQIEPIDWQSCRATRTKN